MEEVRLLEKILMDQLLYEDFYEGNIMTDEKAKKEKLEEKEMLYKLLEVLEEQEKQLKNLVKLLMVFKKHNDK